MTSKKPNGLNITITLDDQAERYRVCKELNGLLNAFDSLQEVGHCSTKDLPMIRRVTYRLIEWFDLRKGKKEDGSEDYYDQERFLPEDPRAFKQEDQEEMEAACMEASWKQAKNEDLDS